MFQKFPVPSSKLFVWIFIPYRMTEKGLISEHYDNPTIRHELADVFKDMSIASKWQPITLSNMYSIVEEIACLRDEFVPVVLNYCDGCDELDGYPGVSVIKLLEAKGIIFTGADSNFYTLTSSKILMKYAFLQSGVLTAPYEVISELNHIQGICKRLNPPLFVKPSDYYGGIGLSERSIVHSDEEIYQQIQYLLQEQQAAQFTLGNIFIERFINGREFTVLVIGSAQQPDYLKTYPSLEFIFQSKLPEFNKFKSRKFRTEVEDHMSGHLVTSSLSDQVSELGKRAYCAVGGNGYGRVDIRMDKTSQELFVLEVNANCSISSQPFSPLFEKSQSSVGTILHLAGIPFAQLMSEIIAEAFVRPFTKKSP
ncbi:MAG: hypothetical protein KME46_12525 [Brasilonema angustatum HA4187-MV1]|jgi:D-alanine-D-alanine ligase-like ATP-grasp enzyme|nr:hypothetical protein [Brasilonema angustatum HA4187-MV1]